MTERVARACASRPWRVLGGWVLAVVVSVVLIATFLGDALTNTAEVTTQTDSKRADQLLAERMERGSQPTEVVVVRSPTLTADDPAFQDQLQRLRQQALATGVLDPAAVASARVEELPVSPDRHAVLLPLPMPPMTISSRSSSWSTPPTAKAASTSSSSARPPPTGTSRSWPTRTWCWDRAADSSPTAAQWPRSDSSRA